MLLKGKILVTPQGLLGCEECGLGIQDDDQRIVALTLDVPDNFFDPVKASVKFTEPEPAQEEKEQEPVVTEIDGDCQQEAEKPTKKKGWWYG